MLLFLGGCAGLPEGMKSLPVAADLPRQHFIESVPFIAQNSYQCGPAALGMVLQNLDIEATQEQLTNMVYSPKRKGSLQPFMVSGLRRLGLVGYEIRGYEALFREVAANNPVVVLQNLGLNWIPRWHYAVVTGYDLDKQRVRMHSGHIQDLQIDMVRFMRTWYRARYWGLVAAPTARLPASAMPAQYFQELLLLEKTGFAEEAGRGYATLLQRYPEQLEPALALANWLYSQDDYPATVAVLRSALSYHPKSDAALNNLAFVLWQLGEVAEAETLAREAVALNGAYQTQAQQTLATIIGQAVTLEQQPEQQPEKHSEQQSEQQD